MKRIKMDQNERILERQFVMNDAGKIDKIRDLYVTYNEKVDLQALKDGGYLKAVEEMMEPVLDKFDDFAPEVLAYWAKRGMVKEAHGRDQKMDWETYAKKTGYYWVDPHSDMEGIQNQYKMWNSFVPVSAFDSENAGRKYPTVVVLHGGFNPISIIDGWGFVQEAAKREWIVIVPALELDDLIDEVLEEAKRLYPIDETRIYGTGFSYGGYMSGTLGNKRPDVYAAVGPCGAPINNNYCSNEVGPEPQKPFDGKPRAIEMGVYMPIFTASGNLDGGRFPIYHARDFHTGEPAVETFVEGINSWARVNHAKEISTEEVLAMRDREDLTDAEREIGLPLPAECFKMVVADGITNYIADLKSEDGVTRIRIMCEMNMPHWPTPEMIRQMYAFFEHFSRDIETKESIYQA